jgi:hypothetical protein
MLPTTWHVFVIFAEINAYEFIHPTMSETTHNESASLSSGVYIAAFIILFLVLAVVADLFTFILGTIGLIVTFAAFYRDNSHHDEVHH